jgi:hypothetical protein
MLLVWLEENTGVTVGETRAAGLLLLLTTKQRLLLWRLVVVLLWRVPNDRPRVGLLAATAR